MVHIKKGELTQEEKELLEVIGKGTGAGLRRRRGQPGRGAWQIRRGAPGLRDLWLRFCKVGSLEPGKSVSPFGLGRVAGAERWGGRSSTGTGEVVTEARPLNPLLVT